MSLSRLAKGVKQLSRLREVPQAFRVLDNWASATAAYAGLAKPPRVLTFRDRNSAAVESFEDLATFWTIFVSQLYPVRPTDRRIIDAGANVGFFTLYAARMAPAACIASIEPHPDTFARLESMVRGNGIAERVTAFSAALYNASGFVHIDNRPGVASQFRSVSSLGIDVPAIGLEGVLDRCGWKTADLLKIDIEGSEYEALLSARPQTLRRVGRIAMEYHPRSDNPELTPEHLFSHLTACGFRLMFHRPDGDGYGVAVLESDELA